jgi:hypothetical protein
MGTSRLDYVSVEEDKGWFRLSIYSCAQAYNELGNEFRKDYTINLPHAEQKGIRRMADASCIKTQLFYFFLEQARKRSRAETIEGASG